VQERGEGLDEEQKETMPGKIFGFYTYRTDKVILGCHRQGGNFFLSCRLLCGGVTYEKSVDVEM
jgi:hypothetical protein